MTYPSSESAASAIVPESQIVRESLLGLLVCSSLTDGNEVARWATREHPPGTSLNKWCYTGRPFGDGEPNPGRCAEHPETHRHFGLEC